ncbi:unnamed protein product [marine sediment metagenome]|uniref:Uncharacterized protein n=1 Tax=marine sediment metagenome TaxID=412755 RepID=X1E718_9ZZZZ
MKKQKQEYFYFKCDTVRGELIVRLEANSKTLLDLLDATGDMKRTVLHAGETATHLPRKPRGFDEWETFRGVRWASVGFKKEVAK